MRSLVLEADHLFRFFDGPYVIPLVICSLALKIRSTESIVFQTVEIASDNDTHTSLLRKKDRYRRAGTAEVWLISAETQEISIYSDRGNTILTSGDTLTGELLPDFSIALDDLFRGL